MISKFQEGDLVNITKKKSFWYNKEGRVVQALKIFPGSVNVEVKMKHRNNLYYLWFLEEDLSK